MRWRVTGLRVLLAVAGLALLAIGVAWFERVSIARRFADAEFAARKIDARYDITRIGPRTQRLEKLVIGNPADPDLTADWVEIDLSAGLGGVSARAVRARGVRLKGRLIDGRLSLGAVDRLLPPPSGEPFRLPDVMLDLADAQMQLVLPQGIVGIGLNGSGNVRDGFKGQVAAVAPTIVQNGCNAGAVRASGALSSRNGGPHFIGPVSVGSADCAGVRIERATLALDARLGDAFDRWNGRADVEIVALASADAGLGGVKGNIGFDGSQKLTRGNFDLTATALRAPALDARGVSIDGSYEAGFAEGLSIASSGALFAKRVVPARKLQSQLASVSGGAGTPVGPLIAALRQAFGGLSRGSEARARYTLAQRDNAGSLKLAAISATSLSGAKLAMQGEAPVTIRWPGGVELAGRAVLSGGGFPAIDASFAGNRGVARVAPFASGGARLALAPVRFAFGSRGLAVDTVATLDGPLGNGRIAGLRVPVSLRPGQSLPQGCFPASFRSLEISGLRLSPASLSTCLAGGDLRIASPRLRGTLGQSPIALAAARLTYATRNGRFGADTLSVRLGEAGRQSAFDLSRLSGALEKGGARGNFTQGAGHIGNVPILISEAHGGWRFAGGELTLDGRLRAADAAEKPRYSPVVSDDFRLRLADGRIVANGTARHPGTGTAIANVAIRHALGPGTGDAIIDMPSLTFDRALQPEQLTPVTLGVVANVFGSMSGRGNIVWTPDGVTSTGRFRTGGLDMAAAFGPVTGLSGEIAFSDLLGLETAPGQQVRIAAINPGILVNDGEIRYRLLPGLKLQVEAGEWPFAGGKLRLEPTILDLSEAAERRLTFKVEGLDAARFIAALEFENIAATGVFDGELPMIFDKNGGRIVGGSLVARDGGGTLSYVGQISNEQLGPWGQIAFDALKAIKYSRLSISLDGALDGDVITRISFAGVNQAPVSGPRAKLPIPVKIIGLNNIPFIFNVTITAKFRQLFEMARSFDDPSILINRALPQLEPVPREPANSVKPPASGDTPQ